MCSPSRGALPGTAAGSAPKRAAGLASRTGGSVDLRDSVVWGNAGPSPGAQLSVASKQPGVNSNLLTDEVPLDVPSGTHVANGIPVEVEAA